MWFFFVFFLSKLKHHYVEIDTLCNLAPHSLQNHCRNNKSQVCNNLSDAVQVLTTNKTHNIITKLLHVWNAVVSVKLHSAETSYSSCHKTLYHQHDSQAVVLRL